MKIKILHLSLKSEPFDVMVTGEKRNEYRSPTKWIMSRLVDKNGNPKHYDVVKFVNGYGKDKPQFICEYKGFEILCGPLPSITYSNGFCLPRQEPGTIDIKLGTIGIKRNIKTK